MATISDWYAFQPAPVHPGTPGYVDYDSGFYFDEEDIAFFKKGANDVVKKFSYPVVVCDETGATLANCSCFSFYDSKTKFLATCRSVADAQHGGPQDTRIFVKMNGVWTLCEVGLLFSAYHL